MRDDRRIGGRSDDHPRVVVARRVQWIDTDASGHHHHAAIIGWVEAAESVLLDHLGLLPLFSSMPRVHYEVDYQKGLVFGQLVDTELVVVQVGTASIRYAFTIRTDDGAVAATGKLVAVYVAPDQGRSIPWSAEARALLTHGAPAPPDVDAAIAADHPAASVTE